jgi:uncharacterized phage-associated protein
MSMAYTPQHIANYFLDRAAQERRSLGHMKVQKLVYIAYGWYLALTGKRLFNEPIQAWQHGPVIRSLYDEFKHFSNEGITSRATEIDLDTWEERTPRIDPSDKTAEMILGKVWAAYNRFSGWQLREKTHEPQTPWSLTYDPAVRQKHIPDELIRPHFSDIIGRILDTAESSRSSAA